jgi:phospholipase C
VAIDHVVVLCLENRSFDHMLGFLPHPDPEFEGLLSGGPYENPGYRGGAAVRATPDAKKVLPFGPDHSHDAVMNQLGVRDRGPRHPANDGFVTSYELKARGKGPGGFGGLLAPLLDRLVRKKEAAAPKAKGCGPLVMRCQDPGQMPALAELARQFAVFDHWFCSVPGETWPNRNFLHAATSDGESDIEIRLYTDCTIFERLEEHGKTWHIYHDDTPQVWAFPRLWDTPERHANWYPTQRFAEHVAAGTLPNYSFIEPDHRPALHDPGHSPGLGGTPGLSDSQHPENNLVALRDYDGFDDTRADTDFARGDRLIAGVYEALRGNPDLFARTLLLITYDEHGGLYDHVPPPTGVPAPGDPRGLVARLLHDIWHRKVHRFDFTMLGPRVPAVLVSPLIEPGTLVSDVHDHASVPATLRAVFAPTAQPLTRRDAWSTPFHTALNRDSPREDLPDLSGVLHPAAPATTPPPTAPTPAAPAAAPGAAGTDVALAASAATRAAAGTGRIPDYYRDFIAGADAVRRHLAHVGEPEVAGLAAGSPMRRATETTAAFSAAAHRHRHPGE